MTLEFTPGEGDAEVSITLPVEYDLLGGSGSPPTGWLVTLNGDAPGTAFTYVTASGSVGDIIEIPAANLTADTAYTVVIGDDPVDTTNPRGFTNPAAETYKFSFQAGTGSGQTVRTAVDAEFATVTPAPYAATVKLSSKTAGAAVQVTIKARADTPITSATDITVNLKGFGVPSSIPERSIIIADDSGTVGDYVGEPGSITVSGTKVTLALYARFPGSEALTAGTIKGTYTITFKQSAGITNPTKAGPVTVSVTDADPKGETPKETIQSVVSLSAGSGARGTDVTVKGVGLGKGGATVYLVNGACADQGDLAEDVPCAEEDDVSLGTGNVSDGTVSVAIETSSSDFIEGVNQVNKDGLAEGPPYLATDSLRGLNQITIVDGTGTTADKSAWFTLTPTIAVDTEAIQQGDELTIIVEDWYYGTVTAVTIGDESAHILKFGSARGDFEVEVIVPPSARLGEQELKVIGTTEYEEGSLTTPVKDVAKGSVVIGALDIVVEPSSFVLGQQFTINVRGFSTDDPVANAQGVIPSDISEIKVGNHFMTETTGGVSVNSLSIDTNGFFTNTFRLANDQYLKPGSYRVQVQDHSGRVALGRVIIPEPTIEVTPEVSRRGTTITVTGENFPSGRVVQVYYRDTEEENQQGAVLADSAGKLSISFTVPSDAEIGEEQDVTAISAANTTDYKAKDDHSLPPQEINLDPPRWHPVAV